MLQKVYTDAKRGAKENDIVPGDQVLLKNTKVTGKLAPNFESEPYKVKAKEGNKYRRNSSIVKPYQPVQESTKKLNLTYVSCLKTGLSGVICDGSVWSVIIRC